MSTEIYATLEPCLTVHSKLAGVDLDAAPEFVINALAAAQVATSGSRSSARDVYHITATVYGAGETRATAKAVIRVTGDHEEPYEILEWREGGRPLVKPEFGG